MGRAAPGGNHPGARRNGRSGCAFSTDARWRKTFRGTLRTMVVRSGTADLLFPPRIPPRKAHHLRKEPSEVLLESLVVPVGLRHRIEQRVAARESRADAIECDAHIGGVAI